jgi:predicted dehydrogenase
MSSSSDFITSLTRRTFLGGAAAASTLILPNYIASRARAQAPSDKLNIAGIGVGGQGAADLSQMESENIVALCDVDHEYAAHTFRRYPVAKVYTDFRKMLEERKEIDAVVIGTPDHLHATIALTAMQLGKHVYCEKPLTHSVWEARRLTQAAAESKVATQMGNQGQASEGTRRLCELVAAEAIGPVREVHVWTDRPSNGLHDVYWPQGVDRPANSPQTPSTFDWDLWLGPAPQRPYDPAYAPFRWRGWWDFGTGALGDIGCHALDPVFRALKLGAPTSVQASSTRVNDETYPLASMVTYQFPEREGFPAVQVTWSDGGIRPARPPELKDDLAMGASGHMLVGDKGKILARRGRDTLEFYVIPRSRADEVGDVPRTLPRSAGHYQEWIDACKGGPSGGSHFGWAGPLTEAVLLGNVALRPQLRDELTGKSLEWDSANLRFTNSEAANGFLRREYRNGWELA